MAKIVLGIGTSHGPMLVTPPETWGSRLPDDRRSRHHYQGRTWSFDELVEFRKNDGLAAQITPEVWRERHAACTRAIERLAAEFEAARPDVAVIVGNDQMEIFSEQLVPPFSVLWGDTIVNNMIGPEKLAKLPPGVAPAMPGYMVSHGAAYDGVPALGRHIIETAIEDEFDVTALKSLSLTETPHAFGFVYRQIMKDRVIPSVPVLVNTFYPPNQPSVRRCYHFGKTLARAIESWDSDARVAVIASGGMTHFVIDEQVDRIILDGMRKCDLDPVIGLGEAIFQAGTSEVKNWIPVAGAMADIGLHMTLVDYVPCYRSEAGTGNAMAFVYWTH